MLGRTPQITGNDKEDILTLYDQYISLRKELYDTLFNLDEENVIRAKSVVADWIYAGNINANQIDVTLGKIQTAQIVDLEVGGNVTMGPNAVISWGQVDGSPNTTYIDEDGIYTGTIEAEQITAGILIGFTIKTAASGARIVMDEFGIYGYNASGKAHGLIYSTGYSYLMLKKAGDTFLIVDEDGGEVCLYGPSGGWFLTSDGDYTRPKGVWNFNDVTAITGLYWDDISGNPFADYDPSDFAPATGSNRYVKTGNSQNLKIQAFEGSEVNYIEVWLGSTYLGQVDLY